MPDVKDFYARSQTLGLEQQNPWSLNVLKILFATPRLYEPLASAWFDYDPQLLKDLQRLKRYNFVDYQKPIIFDTVSATPAAKASKKLDRYRATGRGSLFLQKVQEDIRVLSDKYPKAAQHNLNDIMNLLYYLDLLPSQSQYGISISHLHKLTGMSKPSINWWIAKWLRQKMIVRLPVMLPDIREVVPKHWRINKNLALQLKEIFKYFPQHAYLADDFRISRTKFLTDIDPNRIGLTGATDYDHDIECQKVLAMLMKSSAYNKQASFSIEPRISIKTFKPSGTFLVDQGGDVNLFYQPDAEFGENVPGVNAPVRTVLEYERFQSRRDAWSHIERFLAYVHTRFFPREPAVLRFVVTTRGRERGYSDLISAFADYTIDNPSALPANPIVLAVSAIDRLAKAPDPLALSAWHHVALPYRDVEERTLKVHAPTQSPYQEYFGSLE